jgi:multidrug efflux pump subunit AcrA (membrane-fusion protein)
MNRKISLLIFLFLFALGCGDNGNSRLEQIDTDTFLVKTTKPQKRSISQEILLSGSVKAKEEAELYPRTSGKLLKNILREGDKVRKDQAVALIKIDEVGVVYEPAPVPSTIDGIIGHMYLDKGANVKADTKIALVVDISKVRIQVDAPERYISKIFKGQDALVKVEAFKNSFKGRVYKISPVVDTASRSIPIEILVNNPDYKLKPGMFAEVKIVTSRKIQVLSIAKESIIRNNDEIFVFTMEEGKAQKKSVSTGLSDDKYIEIKKGLLATDDVIYFGLYGLGEGSKVKLDGE